MIYDVGTIRKFGVEVFLKAGLSRKDADICIDSFIESELRGIRTHGITHLKDYCDRLELGTASTGQDMKIRDTSATTITVDAQHAIGMSSAMFIMERCIEKAKVYGSCFASVKNGCHYGFGGYFPMKAAEQGMISFCISNTPALVVPFGGTEPILGTNPLSIAIPAGKYPTLVLDMATSIIAKGKISLALKEGKTIPRGWAIDRNGVETTDPKMANTGALLPFGGAKGYALGLIISIISSALSGADKDVNIPRFWEDKERLTNIGYFMGCINISKFVNIEIFKERVDDIFNLIKSSKPAPGFKEVMIPGEIEFNLHKRNHQNGIELSKETMEELKELSKKYGITFPF